MYLNSDNQDRLVLVRRKGYEFSNCQASIKYAQLLNSI